MHLGQIMKNKIKSLIINSLSVLFFIFKIPTKNLMGVNKKSTYFVTIIFFVSRNPLVIVTKYGGTVRKRKEQVLVHLLRLCIHW